MILGSICIEILMLLAVKNALLCHYCGYEEKLHSCCPHCKIEDSFVSCGPGVERLAEEVKEISIKI